jgi:hypothetical protein
MRRSGKKLPKGINQPAAEIVCLSTDEHNAVSSYLATIGRKGGLKGGKARAQKLSSEQRSEIARLGGLAKRENQRKKIVAKENS